MKHKRKQDDSLAKHDSETMKHINEVRANVWKLITELDSRAQQHDASKFQEPERSIYAAALPKLGLTEYGSPAYQELLAESKPAIEHHWANNRHHAEFFQQNEKWLPVPQYESWYEVSNFGRIKSKKDILKGPLTPQGYLRISLRNSDTGVSRNFMVHRLVGSVFIPNPQNKPFINHKNGIKTDNHVDNLEWVTSSENQIHAYAHGLKEPKVKYVVKCRELDIITEGCLKMEQELRNRGYQHANASTIWSCVNDEEDSLSHLDLHFEGYLIDELGDISFMDSMDLIDIVEMLCDWLAATKRNKNGDIYRSILINTRRYNMSPQMAQILKNTVDRYF